MLPPWMRMLPFAIVTGIARRQAERVPLGSGFVGFNLFKGEMLVVSMQYWGSNREKFVVDSCMSNCYVRDGDFNIATFETLSVRDNNTLHIPHFAVVTNLLGQGWGEVVLRGFAKLVAEQCPWLKRITFELHRASEGSDILALAAARVHLLRVIGAHDVRQEWTNERRICVSGTWERERW